ncbi:transcriptional regulator, MarR family domain protein [Streptococcus pneumoniae GA47368]|nr:transcriptional regulator, MarR family domain protein [Streptococcus pneumoniae GA47368]EHE71238.1 transcriptional regulator, MarR family domain protein [Streptococcus pneumoniae NorthCarolina6A-23]
MIEIQDLLYQLRLSEQASTQLFEKRLGISLTRYQILLFLLEHSPCNQMAVQERLKIDQAALTRHFKILETEGLVERHRNPENQREVLVEAAKYAKEQLVVNPPLQHIRVKEEIESILTEFERTELSRLLDLFGNCKKCYTIFMETVYDKAQKLNSKNFKLLIGVKKETFQLMLEHLNSAYQIQHRKGGRPRSLPMEDQLIMTLRYLRYYPTQRLLAFDFGVGVATVNAIITWVEDTLRASGSFDLDHLEAPSAAVAIDVTESPIQRPKKQSKNYSGKKKRHTLKTQIMLDLTTHKVCQMAFSDGHTHDFTLFKESIGQSLPETTLAFVDLGYLGILKFHENTFIPAKNSKNRRLSEDDKQLNKEMSAIRIEIEHFNAKFKTFQIMSVPYRNRRKRFELRAELICAIINYEVN